MGVLAATGDGNGIEGKSGIKKKRMKKKH